ncbi:hypothetical protein COY25_03345 [Candidatus Uhrbacteria bacterium CG_4_10_14_0_2_um_filter_41_7]|uniref:VIT family protein n=1 Tax=Candidatus Uhrbacteria bacterium CG_4_9_14_3_um_filter_41_35 TaxID=1975034 RepID=A0A2M7XDF1_9BACT|nr:MAG: hypothetical protein COV92_03490 [Candidatus Uhrbacteria bacterium CG11_big_fil_rev_8_21_14_0_20_41_9]PIZ53549.1 MAG: hypothetical protein COY25_03345 [Candidatus Uhrbacteria bacterium CG_4_10_14_0_2_um_filter_41_7]PJA45910.1 MAG: hypothetical protein CO173_04330 [Candidatus Uhrbacteria bacterium CG_4_9_14_3_um_filter_41_35]
MNLQKAMQASIREIVFGMEDSLVSTLGAITGIAAGTGSTYVVILSGIVLIFVEAVSMTAGSYLSSKSAHEVFNLRKQQETSRLLQEKIGDHENLFEFLKRKKLLAKDINVVTNALDKEHNAWLKELKKTEARYAPEAATAPVKAAAVMGFFYLFGGFFPLIPYVFLEVKTAMAPSIIFTALGLFVLGILKARITEGNWLRSSIEMVSISLTAAFLGFATGHLVSLYFNVPVV